MSERQSGRARRGLPGTPSSDRCFSHALARLRDDALGPADREEAAFVVRFAARYVSFDERLMTDVMNVLSRHLGAPVVVENLLLAMRRSPDAAKVGLGLVQLASRARRQGQLRAFVTILSSMQKARAWRSHVSDEMLVDAVAHALEQERGRVAASLVLNRLHDCDGVPAGLGDVVDAHPRLLEERTLTTTHAWRLHQARPTAPGWRLLASATTTGDFVPSPESFGSELDTAIETLEAALGQGAERAPRVRLARWLVELKGTR